MDSPKGPDKIFFSYARADTVFAMKLAKHLRDAGVNVWLDQLDIQAGNLWDTEIEKALNTSNYILVLLSSSSIASNNVMDEVSYALEEGKKIIPVLLNDCTPPFRLRRLQRIDFAQDYDSAFQALLHTLSRKTEQKDEPVEIPLQEQKEKEIWEKACQANTLFSYQQYLAESETGSHKTEAIQLMAKFEEKYRIEEEELKQKAIEDQKLKSQQEQQQKAIEEQKRREQEALNQKAIEEERRRQQEQLNKNTAPKKQKLWPYLVFLSVIVIVIIIIKAEHKPNPDFDVNKGNPYYQSSDSSVSKSNYDTPKAQLYDTAVSRTDNNDAGIDLVNKAFVDDFYSNYNNWTVGATTYCNKYISNGSYFIQGYLNGYSYSSVKKFNIDLTNDFTVSVEATWQDGAKKGFGLDYCSMGPDNHSYTFEINEDGYYSILNLQDNGWVILKSQYSSYINKGIAVNYLKIEKKDNAVSFFINGNVVETLYSSGYSTTGQYFGMRVETIQKIKFNNFRVENYVATGRLEDIKK